LEDKERKDVGTAKHKDVETAKHKDVEKKDTETTEITPVELQQKFYKLDFSQLARSVFSDLEKTSTSTILFRNFDKDRMLEAIQNPQRNEEVLRNLSNFLYIVSPHYRRLCNYYAEMLTLDWYIEPLKLDTSKVNEKQFIKTYNETLFELDTMNIKHEMLKVLQVVFREGIIYGYEYKTDDSYFIQKLDADYCVISGFEDGVYNFKFDFDYFSNDEEKLENYAPEFKTKYTKYKNSRQSRGRRSQQEDLRWQELDSENVICIKSDETIFYPFPPFVGVLPDIYEIQDYKSLKKANSEMQNYALIGGKIPIKDGSDIANDFKIGLDTAIEFGNKISSELPDQIGFILSVFDDLKLFKLSDDKVGTDKVDEATKNFWSAAGISKNLFADDSNTDAAIKFSTITDEQTAFGMLRQIERWINRKLKFRNGKYNFKINMLNTTYLNQEKKVAEELKSAQFGFPNKIRTACTMGLSQTSVSSMTFLENEILGLADAFIPLSSSHTQTDTSATSVTGGENKRPSKEEEEVRIDE